MANLLVADSDGRRRVRIELAAAAAGHKCYTAGSAGETIREALIYVPDAIILPGDLPDASAAEFVRQLRAVDRKLVAATPVVVTKSARAEIQESGIVCAAADPAELVAAAAEAANGPLGA